MTHRLVLAGNALSHGVHSLHNAVRIGSEDADGRRAIAEHILRSPCSLQKIRDQPQSGAIISHSTMHPVLKRNFEVFSACEWLTSLTAHIPNAGEHLGGTTAGKAT